MFATITLSKKHKHIYNIEDDGTILEGACLNDESGICAMPVQKRNQTFRQFNFKVSWTNSPTKRALAAIEAAKP